MTRLFKDIKKDSFFTSYYSPENTTVNVNIQEVFKDNKNKKKIVSGCYIYNYKYEDNSEKERLEIAFRSDEEGWVWMMGAKPKKKNESKKIWYREFILKKDEKNNWKVSFGHEGEIVGKNYYHTKEEGKLKESAKGFENNISHKCMDLNLLDEINKCTDEYSKYRSLILYWKPNNDSQKTLVNLSINMGDQITRWGDDKRKSEIYKKIDVDWPDPTHSPRKRIYWSKNWHTNVADKDDKPLIKLEDEDLAKTKGSWENLYTLCKDDSLKDKEKKYYEIYCV